MSPPADRRGDRARRPAVPPFAVGSLLLVALSSCTSAPPSPLDEEQIAQSLAARDSSPEALREALRLEESSGRIPIDVDRIGSPTDPETWAACTLVLGPQVRRSRRDFEVLREAATSAGSPEPIGVEVDNQRFATSRAQTAWMFGVDVLGLFGVGRAAAAEELANARVREAWAVLEQASFDATFDVRLDLVRLSIARQRTAVLEALRDEAAVDSTRLRVFEDHGWLPSAELQMGEGALARLERSHALALAQEADAIAALARRCGLPPGSAWYESVDASFLDRLEAELPALEPARTPRELLARLPRLRARVLEYAVAEAELRLAVANERWPELRIGPQWMVMPDDVVAGGMLRLQTPFPGSQRGPIRAALARRDLERDAVEDELLGALADLHVAEEHCRRIGESAREQARRSLDAAKERLVRSRAVFAVEPGALESWTMALDQVRGEWETYFESTEHWWKARYDAARLQGLDPVREARP